jgi:hypothetical protein
MVSDKRYARVFFGRSFVSATGAGEHCRGGADVSCGSSGGNMLADGGGGDRGCGCWKAEGLEEGSEETE